MSVVIRKAKRYNTSKSASLMKHRKNFSGKKSSNDSINSQPLGLKRGDVVRVRSKEQILQTLDENNKFDGCYFMDEMWQYCGTQHRVLKRVESFYDEANLRMCKARDTFLLEGIYCSGKMQGYKQRCDRQCFSFWKEAWLERVE